MFFLEENSEGGLMLPQTRKSVLCFVSYYLPGFKAGGPIRTIQNMISHLGDEFELKIVTKDRDIGDLSSYPGVLHGEWISHDCWKVVYLPSRHLNLKTLTAVLEKESFDVVYLNSFFDFNFTIKPLVLRKLGLFSGVPVILAPRGEFSRGALGLKSFKKKIFIKLSILFGLYKSVTWQASSELEKKDIINALGVLPSSILVAKDLPVLRDTECVTSSSFILRDVRLVFLSRISPMKNLEFTLKVLSRIKAILIFDIYGPIEDEVYWVRCLELIEKLPSNIRVAYCGEVTPDQVGHTFSRYDLFFFPSLGENYGHVIAESLSVGTAVLTSDKTPWSDLEDEELGWNFSLTEESLFIEKIEYIASLSVDERAAWRERVRKASFSRINCAQDIDDNKLLFNSVLKSFKDNNVNGGQ